MPEITSRQIPTQIATAPLAGHHYSLFPAVTIAPPQNSSMLVTASFTTNEKSPKSLTRQIALYWHDLFPLPIPIANSTLHHIFTIDRVISIQWPTIEPNVAPESIQFNLPLGTIMTRFA
jgi:hypothetical protein